MELLETEHVAAIAATAVVAGLCTPLVSRLGATQVTALLRGLAVLLLAGYVADHVIALARGDWEADRYLPFHLSDAVTLVAAYALWTLRPLAVELTYFWGLTASLQAVLTPNLGEGFPDPYFWTFFLYHGAVVVAACVLVFGIGQTPRPGAVGRAFAATVVVAAAAAVADLLTGGNYMYLREKPGSGSLLDLLGPWPVYIAGAGAIALLMFVALDTPFRRWRRAASV
jgi:hypothetical integral membrane protein (TIGR02206 family)